jgi:hypothetical protein
LGRVREGLMQFKNISLTPLSIFPQNWGEKIYEKLLDRSGIIPLDELMEDTFKVDFIWKPDQMCLT